MEKLPLRRDVELPALQHWREHTLSLMLRIILLAPLPVLALEMVRLLPQGGHFQLAAEALTYLFVVAVSVSPRIPYRWRAFALVCANLLLSSYLLMISGLVGAGRVYLVANIFFAALLLGYRATLLVGLGSTVALALSGLSFANRPPEAVAALAARLTDPNTLTVNSLFTLIMGTLAAIGAISLVGQLARSLRANEQALSEREQTNAELEQHVGERTHALEQALGELSAREEWLRTTLQTALDGFYIVDRQQRILDVNEAYCAMSGYSRAELLAMRVMDLEAIEQPAEIDARIRRITSHGSDRFESRHRRKDGTLFDVEASITYIGGEHMQIVCFCRDITARKLAEQALARQLDIQAAVARCSQILLRPAATVGEQRRRLNEALAAIGSVHYGSQTAIMENIEDPIRGPCAHTIAFVYNTQGGDEIPTRGLVLLPWRLVPAAIRETYAAGKPVFGPLDGILADYPELLAFIESFEVRSVQSWPIFCNGSWWGTLVFADTENESSWDDGALQLLQMAAEIIGTAIQRWSVEAELSLQLRYAETLARCSQLLLQPATSDHEQRLILDSVMATLREMVDVSRLYVYQPPANLQSELALDILADAHAPGMAPYIEPTPEQILDAPPELIGPLYQGCWTGGPVPGQFPANPHFQQSLDQNSVQVILMLPITYGGVLWGVLSALDRVKPRAWDEPTVQLLRTAAEMLATVQQSWETTRALREREHFIQRVAEATPDVIHVVDLATRRSLYVNRPLAPMLGLEPDQPITYDAATLQGLLPSEEYYRLTAHYERLATIADGQVIELEYLARLGDGTERRVLSRDLVFARDAAGHPSQVLSIAQDVTATRLTERALAASEARLRALRDALPDLLFVISADGTFRESYPSQQTELLMPAEEFLGRTLGEVLPPELATLGYSAIERVCAQRKVELFEYPLTLGAEVRTFEARIVPIAGDELLAVVRDITERRRATEALLVAKEAAEAADRAKSLFLAHISHEIRTPLTAVIGMTSLLRDTQLSTQQREYVATLHTGAETLLTIIGNILDFSKIEAGRLELSNQPFDLRACLRDAHDLVVPAAAQKRLGLFCVIDPGLPAFLAGDGGRLRQVLVNLLSNAVKFTATGTVTFSAGGQPLADGRYELALTVRDTGIGIAPDQLARIFVPFVQGDGATTRHFEGAGLGLAISKQLVELMEGQISVASTPGLGSTFQITLPLPIVAAPPVEHLAARAGETPPPPMALRVLLVEDNPINREVLRRLLESLGYTPDVVADGAAALDAVCRRPYDVVLMDIQMPTMDGEEATRRIRALPDIGQPTIVALTASALRGDRERYLAAGMDDYLSKPVQNEALRAILSQTARRNEQAPAPDPARPLAAEAQPAADNGHIDWAMLDQQLESLGGTWAQAAMLVLDLFRDTLAAQLNDITAAVAAEDRPRVRTLAHKLRGGSRQLGATMLADDWTALEEAAQQPDAPLGAALARARRTFEETLALLTARLA